MQRRTFVRATALSASRVLGANDRVRVGLIGCGGRGRYVARLMREAPNIDFPAVADVYDLNAAAAREWAGPGAAAFRDFRKLLERQDVDAVLVATPDHWHAQATILACQAGKDVYVEKPVSLTVREGRAMVNAARRYQRIVCVGTQHRSAKHFPKIAEMIRRGDIGQVKFVRVWNYANLTPQGIGRKPDQPPPAGLDWDMYLGPAPWVPFNPNRFLGTYRWFSDYSGGYITDFGHHRLDTMQQIMGVTAPKTISAAGGRFVIDDDGDVPDLLQVTYEYDGFIATYEGSNLNGFGMGAAKVGPRYYNSRGEFDQPNGICFYGTEGTIFAERTSWAIYPEAVTERHQPARAVQVFYENVPEPTRDHAAHFIDCVRTRQTPSADIEIGHRSTSVALLGNIAYRTGFKLRWDAAREDFVNAPEASRLLSRQARRPWNLVPTS